MRWLIIALLLLVIPLRVTAADGAAGFERNAPVKITADHLDADDSKQVLVFSGAVQAQQGDVFIYAKTMTVHYAAATAKGSKRDITQVVADGDVRIVQTGRTATGRHAVFDRVDGKITLTGDPRVVEGENNVSGERIIVYLNDNRSIVEGGKQRVRAMFVPGEKNQ